MQTTAEYFCAFCGEPNFTFVDLSAGMQQSYVEDCQVCCRPNILYLRVDEQTLDIEIDSDYEGWSCICLERGKKSGKISVPLLPRKPHCLQRLSV